MKKIIIGIIIGVLISLHSSTSVLIDPVNGAVQPKIERKSFPHILCGDMLGTGISIDRTQVSTAAHVISTAKRCGLAPTGLSPVTEPNLVTESVATDLDWGTLTMRPKMFPAAHIACSAIVAGQPYWIAGYADGNRGWTVVRVTGDSRYADSRTPEGTIFYHQRVMLGTSHHGMSGGPVIDQNGNVVAFLSGISTMEVPVSLVKEFADTRVCGSDK